MDHRLPSEYVDLQKSVAAFAQDVIAPVIGELYEAHAFPYDIVRQMGEMGLFGNGLHTADVQVLDQPAQLLAVDGDQLLKAMLFDADLSIELLNLISQRCLQGNELVGLLLDGIKAAHSGDDALLQQTCAALRRRRHSIADAADQLEALRR